MNQYENYLKEQNKIMLDKIESLYLVNKELRMDEAILNIKLSSISIENKQLKSELRKWNDPINERLKEAKKQYMESDCRASASVYISALEHALKHINGG